MKISSNHNQHKKEKAHSIASRKKEVRIILFPAHITTFQKKYSDCPYSTLLKQLANHRPEDLANHAESIADHLSTLVQSTVRFEVFVSNWIPRDNTSDDIPFGDCIDILDSLTHDAWSNFLRTDEIQVEKNLYLLFQLVTLAFVLRYRRDFLTDNARRDGMRTVEKHP